MLVIVLRFIEMLVIVLRFTRLYGRPVNNKL